MYGGGNIGRGFIGATLSHSGYEVTFIDVAEPLVKALQEKHQYPVRYVSSEGYEDIMIEHVTAVNGNDQEAASEAIAGCDIMATAVGARILKFIVPNIVVGLRKRWARTDAPLNIIICENLNDANKILEGMLKEHLSEEEKALFDARVGLVEASIGRMVPVQTEEMKDGDPMRVCVERYGFLPVDQAAIKGEVPELQNLVPYEPFDFYIKRKLFIHNMGHATCAYLGGYVGRKYIYAAILQHSDLLNEPSVILADIGGWTVDIMRLDNRIPHAASCRSLELGMIRCLDEIAEQVRRSLNLSLTSVQIENVLRGSPDSMDDRVKAIIQREAGSYARRILSAIAEAGLDCRAMPVVFLGGGAGLMKRYLPQGSVLRPVILDDDKLNAQAYERLASQVAGHAG